MKYCMLSLQLHSLLSFSIKCTFLGQNSLSIIINYDIYITNVYTQPHTHTQYHTLSGHQAYG